MSMEAFDTLAFAKKLKNAGYSDVQAEGLVEAQAEVFRGMLDSSLATKTELKEEIAAARSDLKADIAAVRTELKEDISGLRTELYKALIAQTFALIAAMVAIVGAFKLFG